MKSYQIQPREKNTTGLELVGSIETKGGHSAGRAISLGAVAPLALAQDTMRHPFKTRHGKIGRDGIQDLEANPHRHTKETTYLQTASRL